MEGKTTLHAGGGENSLVCWNISHGYFLGFSRGTQLEIQWLIGFLQALCKINCCIQKDAVQFPQLFIGAYSNWGKDGISWLLLGNWRKCGIPVNPPPWLQAGHGLLHKLCWVHHHHLAALAQLADLAVNLDEARKGRPVRGWWFNPWQVLNTPNEEISFEISNGLLVLLLGTQTGGKWRWFYKTKGQFGLRHTENHL